MTNSNILSLVFVSILFFSGCSDDDDELIVEAASVVQYNGNSIDLDKGYLEALGENQGLGSFDLEAYLMSSSVSYDQTSETKFSGDGNLIYIDFNSSGEKDLTAGTYNYLEKGGQRDAFTFSGGNIYVGYDTAVASESYEEITGGTIKVVSENDKIIITIDLVTTNSTIKGTYSGTFESI